MAKRLKNTLLSSILLFLFLIETYSITPSSPAMPPHAVAHTLTGLLDVPIPNTLKRNAFEWLKAPAEAAGLDFVIANRETPEVVTEGQYGETDFLLGDVTHVAAGTLLTIESRPSFSIVLHPSHITKPWTRFDSYAEGIELVNLDSQWLRQLNDSPFSFFGSAITFPLNQFVSCLKLLQPFSKDSIAWDAMSAAGGRHFAVAGHGLKPDLSFAEGSPFHAGSMEKSFRLVRNVLFLESSPLPAFEDRREQILSAVREGRSAIHFAALYPYEGGDWHIDCGQGPKRAGAKVKLEKGCLFRMQVPPALPFRPIFRLYRNGEIYKEMGSGPKSLELPISEGGIYRLEVWAHTRSLFRFLLSNDTPYVFYNPVYVE